MLGVGMQILPLPLRCVMVKSSSAPAFVNLMTAACLLPRWQWCNQRRQSAWRACYTPRQRQKETLCNHLTFQPLTLHLWAIFPFDQPSHKGSHVNVFISGKTTHSTMEVQVHVNGVSICGGACWQCDWSGYFFQKTHLCPEKHSHCMNLLWDPALQGIHQKNEGYWKYSKWSAAGRMWNLEPWPPERMHGAEQTHSFLMFCFLLFWRINVFQPILGSTTRVKEKKYRPPNPLRNNLHEPGTDMKAMVHSLFLLNNFSKSFSCSHRILVDSAYCLLGNVSSQVSILYRASHSHTLTLLPIDLDLTMTLPNHFWYMP